jgi:hypothetical protein
LGASASSPTIISLYQAFLPPGQLHAAVYDVFVSFNKPSYFIFFFQTDPNSFYLFIYFLVPTIAAPPMSLSGICSSIEHTVISRFPYLQLIYSFLAGRDFLDSLRINPSIRAHRAVTPMLWSPVKRAIEQRKQGREVLLNRSLRVVAALMQATGTERRPPCNRCSRANGP